MRQYLFHPWILCGTSLRWRVLHGLRLFFGFFSLVCTAHMSTPSSQFIESINILLGFKVPRCRVNILHIHFILALVNSPCIFILFIKTNLLRFRHPTAIFINLIVILIRLVASNNFLWKLLLNFHLTYKYGST